MYPRARMIKTAFIRIPDTITGTFCCCFLYPREQLFFSLGTQEHHRLGIWPLIERRIGTQHNYCDVIMGAIASQITSVTIVYSAVYSDADERKHQSSASLAFVRWIHRGPVNSPHKWPVTRKMFPFDDVIMQNHCKQTVAMVRALYFSAQIAVTTYFIVSVSAYDTHIYV